MEKKQISVHRNIKDLIRDKMGIQKLKKKTFKLNVLLRINIYCWAPKWYSFGKSIARPERGGAEFQDGLKSHPVFVKKPFQDVPRVFPSAQRNSNPANVVPLPVLSPSLAALSRALWSLLLQPGVQKSFCGRFPLFTRAAHLAQLQPVHLPLGRLIRTLGVPRREGSGGPKERGVWGSRGDGVWNSQGGGKDKHRFFSSIFLSHIKLRLRKVEKWWLHNKQLSLNSVLRIIWGFPGGSEVKASASNAGDLGSIPGLGRSPGEGNGNPLQYSCLENPMDGGAW